MTWENNVFIPRNNSRLMKREASESFVAPGLTCESRLIFGSEFFVFTLPPPYTIG